MFVLARLRDSVRLTPQQMRHGMRDAVFASLSSKYCNRVLPSVGLVVAVRDILETGDAVVHPGREGTAHVSAVFRAIVFRPFPGEVLEGAVRSASPEGVRVSLSFFDDVLVPPRLVRALGQEDAMRFEAAEQVWCWHYGAERLFMDVGLSVRVRVEADAFDEAPPSKRLPAGAVSPEATPRSPPYRVTASVSEDGLGLTQWWRHC